jgi:crotonobetainyl-CoA:carnitine CoA-transferase CaiB-like acyl-CoA transferase
MTSLNGPLEGIRVLDLSRVLAGPYAAMVLGDLGAEVIKVERPGVGDDLRGWGPPFAPGGESTYFLGVNRNKRGISLDLATEAGRDVVRELAASADVVIENFRVGMLEGMGLGYEDLRAINPGLVYCSISGFGQVGPMAAEPGYDVMVQAMSGLMSVTGEPDGRPMRVGVAIVDLVTGLFSANGILAALQARTRTGVGQRVDLSLLESALAVLPNLTAGYLVAGAEPERFGTGHPNVTPYGVFPTSDGYIVIAVGSDPQWVRLCRALGEPDFADHADFARNADRIANRAEVERIVTGWCMRHDTATLSGLLRAGDVPSGPVLTIPQALELPQVAALGLVGRFPAADGTSVPLVRSPLGFSRDPRSTHLAAPRLDVDTESVLLGLGLDAKAVARWRDEGAFGRSDGSAPPGGGSAT